jgi:hypothetical protein
MSEQVSPDPIEAQIRHLHEGVREIRTAVETLSADTFLEGLGNWSPRDIVAHLIGWNRYMVLGARQLLSGELPFYDADPGRDYCDVNARLVAKYPSSNQTELLAEHERAAAELATFLRSLAPDMWMGDTGVLLDGEELKIGEGVDELIEDHFHHSRQIHEWARGNRRHPSSS